LNDAYSKYQEIFTEKKCVLKTVVIANSAPIRPPCTFPHEWQKGESGILCIFSPPIHGGDGQRPEGAEFVITNSFKTI